MNSKVKGEISQSMIMSALLRRGYSVSIPFGDSQRYDIILDKGGKLFRVQCKTARIKDGALRFNLYSLGYKAKRKLYHGEVDIFAVYDPVNDKIYMFPFSDFCTQKYEAVFRLYPSKNGQVKGIKFASDYELDAWESSSWQAEQRLDKA